MTQRDPNFLVKPSFGNMLSSEQQGFKPVIKGNVQFAKMKPRQPMLNSSSKVVPNIYSYADSIKSALNSTRATGKKPLFKGM